MNKLIKYSLKSKFLFNKSLASFINFNHKLTLKYFCYFQNLQSIYNINGFCSNKKYNKIFMLSCFNVISFFKNIKIKQIFFFGSPFIFFLKKIKNFHLKRQNILFLN